MTNNDADNIFCGYICKTAEGNSTLNLPNDQTVNTDFFVNLFKDVPARPSYEDLILIDGGNLGYKDFFDRCKLDGILL